MFVQDNILKPPALVQIDCDGELALSNHYCIKKVNKQPDKVYVVLKRFLSIFANHDIKATFFICGQDIEDEDKRNIIGQAVKDGHELANHTYSHPGAFLPLRKSEKVNEILKTQELIKNYFGIKACGFRAPNFEVDEELIEILEDNELVYDCSILPTPFSPFIRVLKTMLTNNKASVSFANGYLGPLSFCFAPRNPYLPSINTVWEPRMKGENGLNITEIPVTVSPIFKIPIHASYALAYPEVFSRFITRYSFKWLVKKNLPLVYVFHLGDLCEKDILRGVEGKLYRSIEQRLSFVNWICKEIKCNFNSMTTIELVRSLYD